MKDSDLYFKYVDLMQNTEDNRTARLNTFLIICTLFVVAWAQMVVGSSASTLISAFITAPGFIYARIWKQIAVRTNGYLEEYRRAALELEKATALTIVSTADKAATEYTEKKIKSDAMSFSTFTVKVPFYFSMMFGLLSLISVAKFCLHTFTCLLDSHCD